MRGTPPSSRKRAIIMQPQSNQPRHSQTELSDHDHPHGSQGWLQSTLPFLHGHSHGDTGFDSALESSERGIWALKVSLLGLGLTAAFQVLIYMMSGSVALLADTIHNASDALTA